MAAAPASARARALPRRIWRASCLLDAAGAGAGAGGPNGRRPQTHAPPRTLGAGRPQGPSPPPARPCPGPAAHLHAGQGVVGGVDERAGHRRWWGQRGVWSAAAGRSGCSGRQACGGGGRGAAGACVWVSSARMAGVGRVCVRGGSVRTLGRPKPGEEYSFGEGRGVGAPLGVRPHAPAPHAPLQRLPRGLLVRRAAPGLAPSATSCPAPDRPTAAAGAGQVLCSLQGPCVLPSAPCSIGSKIQLWLVQSALPLVGCTPAPVHRAAHRSHSAAAPKEPAGC